MRQLFGFYLFLMPLALTFTTFPAFASVHPAVNQHDPSHTYQFLVCINALFFVGILVAMTVFYMKGRKTGPDMIWSMIPAILLIVIFGIGWINFQDNHLGETFYAVKFPR